MLEITRKTVWSSVFLLCFCVLFIFMICTSNTAEPIPRDIKILIRRIHLGSPVFSTFLHITDEGVLEIIHIPASRNPEREFEVFDTALFGNFIECEETERWFQRAHVIGERQLSQRQLSNIWALADDVIPIRRRWHDEIPYTGHFSSVTVIALIGGEEYRTLFSSDFKYIPPEPRNHTPRTNKSLLPLIYYLIDLSPVRLIVGE